MKKIIVDVSDGLTRAAVLDDGEFTDYYAFRGETGSVTGNIYKAKVRNVLKGMQAAFVDIGFEKNAFLAADDIRFDGKDFDFDGQHTVTSISKMVYPGQELIVQVLKDETGAKGAKVTSQVTLSGNLTVLLPSVSYVGVSKKISDDAERERLRAIVKGMDSPYGWIVRTAGQNMDAEDFRAEMEYLTACWERIQKDAGGHSAPVLLYSENAVLTVAREYFDAETEGIYINSAEACELLKNNAAVVRQDISQKVQYREGNIFSAFSLSSKINSLCDRRVWLDNGAYLVFDYTEALTVIDVNTGKFTGSTGSEDTFIKTNLSAAKEIARQLRLRSIGGIIIIDFIDMKDETERERVLATLREETAKDRTKTVVVGFTALGLAELTRKKTRRSLISVMCTECPRCGGSGVIKK